MDRFKYHIDIFWSDEDGGYIANVPDLKYCSAFGETYEEALREVLVAMELHIGVLEEMGRPVPEPRTVREPQWAVFDQVDSNEQDLQTLAQESANAYSDFLNSALSFYQEALRQASEIAESNLQTAQQVFQQSADAANQAMQSHVQAAQQSAQQSAQAAQQSAQATRSTTSNR